MKNLIILITLTFFFIETVTAQPKVPQTPRTDVTSASTSSSETRIKMNLGDGQQLKIKANDTHFSMDMDFKSSKTNAILEILSNHLGRTKRTFQGRTNWEEEDGRYTITLEDGVFEANIKKDELSKKEYQKILRSIESILDALDWAVDMRNL